MFESVREWCVFPVNVHRYSGRKASGDVNYADPVVEKCYRVGDMRTITDKFGKEYVSFSHIYLPPEVAITMDDRVSFPDDPVPRDIRRLSGYFDGNTGKLSMWVVYL